MRLKASYTIENSVIIPLFTLIILSLIVVIFYLHDTVVIKNALFQTAMKIEQESQTIQSEELMNQSVKYLQDKTMFTTDIRISLNQESNKFVCIGEAKFLQAGFMNQNAIYKQAEVVQNNQPQFIRKINLVNEVKQ